jgi:hypothetical protein
MKKLSMILPLVFLLCFIFGCQKAKEVAEEVPAKETLRVGTFDSRAVAVAYAGSEKFDQYLGSMREKYDKAKEEGNEKVIKELEAWGPASQQVMHQQVFSIASVAEYLEKVKAELPKIAEEAGVDVIMSKWEIAYKNPSIEIVDVTSHLVKLFNPDEKTLETIETIPKQDPMPLLELLLEIRKEQKEK